MFKGVFVSGIGTEVGKTVVSAILVRALGAAYWKPVQSGDLQDADSHKIREWAGAESLIYSEAYRLQTPMSPHAAAAIDGVKIELDRFELPAADRFLVVEGAGGLLAPLNERHTVLDLIERLELPVALVSRHYLGSINHTLLSLEVLRRRGIPLAALLFNGPSHPSTESVVEKIGGTRALLRVNDLSETTRDTIAAEANRLKPALLSWKKELDNGSDLENINRP